MSVNSSEHYEAHPFTRAGVLAATRGMSDRERFQYALAALDARNMHLVTEPDPLLGRFVQGSFAQKMWAPLWESRGFIVPYRRLWVIFPRSHGQQQLPAIYAAKIRKKPSVRRGSFATSGALGTSWSATHDG